MSDNDPPVGSDRESQDLDTPAAGQVSESETPATGITGQGLGDRFREARRRIAEYLQLTQEED